MSAEQPGLHGRMSYLLGYIITTTLHSPLRLLGQYEDKEYHWSGESLPAILYDYLSL